MWSNILLNEWRNELINNICFWSCIKWKDSDVGKLYNVDELHGWIFLSMIVKGWDNLTLNCDDVGESKWNEGTPLQDY